MSERSPTLKSLLAIGFEERPTEFGVETVGYRFRNLDLIAFDGVSKYLQPVVTLSGTLNTGRSLGDIEHQVSPYLSTPESAAAWVSHALNSIRKDLEPLPDWMLEGERHWDLIPTVRDCRRYEVRPKCEIDLDQARIMRSRLRTALAKQRNETRVDFAFDGQVLSIFVARQEIKVIGSGMGWPCGYRVKMKPDQELPARFRGPVVDVSYFDGVLKLDHCSFDAVEV